MIGKTGAGMLVRKFKKAMVEATSLPVYLINAPRLIPGVDFFGWVSVFRYLATVISRRSHIQFTTSVYFRDYSHFGITHAIPVRLSLRRYTPPRFCGVSFGITSLF